jgi:hypothetical protein
MAVRVARTDEELDLARWRLQARQVDVTINDLKADHGVVTIDDGSGVFWASLNENPADGGPCWWVHWHFEPPDAWGPLVLEACKEAVRLGLGDIPARWRAQPDNPIVAPFYKGKLKARSKDLKRPDSVQEFEVTPAQVVRALSTRTV